MILLDTSALSRVLRRKPSPKLDSIATHLEELLLDNTELAIPGIVVQEILSGIRSPQQFTAVRRRLQAFPIVLASTDDHFNAARIVNQCRSGGLVAGSIDALIAALAIRRDAELFSLDRDFFRIAAFVPLRLLPIGQ